eukprot:jgi/Ulvmu1/10437/UM062_0034.1
MLQINLQPYQLMWANCQAARVRISGARWMSEAGRSRSAYRRRAADRDAEGASSPSSRSQGGRPRDSNRLPSTPGGHPGSPQSQPPVLHRPPVPPRMPTPPDAPPRPPSTPVAPRTPRYADFIESATGIASTDRRGRRGGMSHDGIVIDDGADEFDSDVELVDGTMVPQELQAAVVDRTASEKLMNPVIKVYCRHTEPNYSLPWQRQRQYSSSSSGFAVLWGDVDSDGNPKRWLLTNGHSVEYHSQVRVKRRGDDKKYLARVLAIGTECDLALLTVDDAAFWEGLNAMTLGPMPSLQESVAVVGYPLGGDTISVTAGVVSRIEVTTYVHGSTQLLGVQIDAAINSGNSGGPVFDEAGRLVGVAFQSFAGTEVENVGWVIPTSVIAHFLDDYARNTAYTGFPLLGVQWQRMESDALKRHMRMKAHHKGVLVVHVSATSCSHGVLRPGDVLMEFDGNPISSDGTVAFRTGERIMFSYLISQRFVGDAVPLTVLRDGEPHDLHVTLTAPGQLVPAHLASRDPSYYVCSGLVFTVACEPYLASEYGPDFLSLAPVAILDKVRSICVILIYIPRLARVAVEHLKGWWRSGVTKATVF